MLAKMAVINKPSVVNFPLPN